MGGKRIMGELIQIRVTAKIHDHDQALKKWAGLVGLAFGPEKNRTLEGHDLLAQIIDALHDKERLGLLPETISGKISKDIAQVYSSKKKMDSYLSDRNPQEADRISYQIEELLDRMEEKVDAW
jgi:hypothetical protein